MSALLLIVISLAGVLLTRLGLTLRVKALTGRTLGLKQRLALAPLQAALVHRLALAAQLQAALARLQVLALLVHRLAVFLVAPFLSTH